MDKRPLILIVDDEISVRHTLEALLAKEGYDLVFAARGDEALSMLESIEADVILLDVMLPVVDGFEICNQLKSADATRTIPVILLTALDSKEAMTLGYEAGADDFLTKPVGGTELRARVRSMLRAKRQQDDVRQTITETLDVPLTGIKASVEELKSLITDERAHRLLSEMTADVHHVMDSLSELLERAVSENR